MLGMERESHPKTIMLLPLRCVILVNPNTALHLAEEEEELSRMLSSHELVDYCVPPHSVPIRADVTTFDFKSLGRVVQFDVIMMDPPWQLASANPTRGVTIGYETLGDTEISLMDVPSLQTDGFLFIWVINSRFSITLEMMEAWGYTFVDEIAWVKATTNRRLAKSHGFFLQHAKETCLVGVKGDPKRSTGIEQETEGTGGMASPMDVIISTRRGQSQKPEELYELVEQLCPNGIEMLIIHSCSLTITHAHW
jgi:mRNA m6A methyltransferase catalytic subunit